jgi:hypothetical protein
MKRVETVIIVVVAPIVAPTKKKLGRGKRHNDIAALNKIS